VANDAHIEPRTFLGQSSWYEENGIDWRIEKFPWIGWRGVFVRDPEGNTVELVSYDASVSPDE
jgi:hypothetical protein